MWSRVSSAVSVNCWFRLSTYKGYRPRQMVLENVGVLCTASCWAYNRDQQGISRLPLAIPQSSEVHECYHIDGHFLQIVLGDTNVILESLGLTNRDVAMRHISEWITQAEALTILSHIKTSRTEEQKEVPGRDLQVL